MSDSVIRVENVSKQYILGKSGGSEGLRHEIHNLITEKIAGDSNKWRQHHNDHQHGKQLPSGKKQHEQRPGQIELLFQRQSPVMPNDKVVRHPGGMFPKVPVVKRKGRGGDQHRPGKGQRAQALEQQDDRDKEIKAGEYAQNTPQIKELPIEDSGLLKFPNTEVINEETAENKENVDPQSRIPGKREQESRQHRQ